MRAFLACLLLAISGWSQAAIKTQEMPYQSSDGTQLIGYYAYDDSLKGARPGIVVVHEWWGLNDYAKRRARDLAALRRAQPVRQGDKFLRREGQVQAAVVIDAQRHRRERVAQARA